MKSLVGVRFSARHLVSIASNRFVGVRLSSCVYRVILCLGTCICTSICASISIQHARGLFLSAYFRVWLRCVCGCMDYCHGSARLRMILEILIVPLLVASRWCTCWCQPRPFPLHLLSLSLTQSLCQTRSFLLHLLWPTRSFPREILLRLYPAAIFNCFRFRTPPTAPAPSASQSAFSIRQPSNTLSCKTKPDCTLIDAGNYWGPPFLPSNRAYHLFTESQLLFSSLLSSYLQRDLSF